MSYPRYVPHSTGDGKWTDTDINAVVDHVLAGETVTGYIAYHYKYILRHNSGVYDAIDATGTRVYGGPTALGGFDGSDASEIINALISDADAGDLIVIANSSSPYDCESPIVLSKAIFLCGQNREYTTLQKSNAGFAGTKLISITANRCVLQDLLLDGVDETINFGLDIAAAECTFNRVYATNFVKGCGNESASDAMFSCLFNFCKFVGNQHGVYIDSANIQNTTLFHCGVYSNTEGGLYFKDSTNINIYSGNYEINGAADADEHWNIRIAGCNIVNISDVYMESLEGATNYADIWLERSTTPYNLNVVKITGIKTNGHNTADFIKLSGVMDSTRINISDVYFYQYTGELINESAMTGAPIVKVENINYPVRYWNTGRGSIANGTSTATVTHLLNSGNTALTPNLILLTGYHTETCNLFYSSLTDTTFKVNAKDGNTTGTRYFTWVAEYNFQV